LSYAFTKVPVYLPGFSVGAEDSRFNPFTLRTTLKGLSVRQEKLGELVSCRILSVALRPTALFRLALGLREVRVVGPKLTVVIDEEGRSVLNYLPKEAEEAPGDEKPAFIPRMVVRVLDVSEGELSFESRLPNAPQKLEAKPISFRLENLSTIPDDGGKMRLEARTDKDERLSWEGGLTLRPPHLWGRVEVNGIDLGRVTEGMPDLPVELSEGRLDASTEYDVALDSRALNISVKDGRVAIEGLMWRLKAGGEKGFRGPFGFHVGPARMFAVAKAPGTPQARLTVDADVPVESSGSIRLKAYVTPKPLVGGADLEIAGLPLAVFSPLGPPPTQATLDSGSLDLRLKAAIVDVDADLDLFMSVSGLSVSDKASRRPMVRVGRFAIESARLSTRADKLDVAAVRVDKPYLRLARAKDGKTNVESALGISLLPSTTASAQAEPPKERPVAQVQPAKASGQKPWKVRLKRFAVTGGRVLAEDSAVAPAFSLTVSDAKVELTNLANDTRSTAAFSASAKVVDAPVSADGTVRLSTAAAWVVAHLKGDGIQLPVFSPYSGMMVGYKIDKGAFSFDLQHQLDDRLIATKNRAIIDQMEFGDKVESPDAIKAPVKLGLAILKDRRGVIDLDVPIDGSLDDPEFHIAKVVIKTLVNIVVKAALSPFSALSGIFGSKKDLGKVEFAAGGSELTGEIDEQLGKVAKALDDRPKLFIGIRGGAGRIDGMALGDRALLVKLRGKDAGREPLTPKESEKVLSLYRKTFDVKAEEVPGLEEARMRLDERWRGPDAELRTLALARAGVIKGALQAKGVAEERFFNLEPASGFEKGSDSCQLQLDMR
jgi:hypothetical protein